MKILPPRTLPPPTAVSRRHTPRKTTGRYGYRAYRACLRWEFGFTCAFCLLHESDLAEYGAEGLGLTSVEHFEPASQVDDRINEYENCFYACRFCNGSRSDAPVVDRDGRRLLDPCADAWADHFTVTADNRLSPADADRNALYTEAIYDLNEPRKTRLRRCRRERIEEWSGLLAEGPRHVTELLARSAQASSTAESGELLAAAEILRDCILRASRDFVRYASIPQDFDAFCRCQSTDNHSLPSWLGDQSLDLT
jgi:hypothetical protein